MTNDELQKLAAALGDCGKALLRISEAMAVKEDNPPDSEAKSKKSGKAADTGRCPQSRCRQGPQGIHSRSPQPHPEVRGGQAVRH